MSEQANVARLLAVIVVLCALAGGAVASVAGYQRGSIAVGVFSGLAGAIVGQRLLKSSKSDGTKTNSNTN